MDKFLNRQEKKEKIIILLSIYYLKNLNQGTYNIPHKHEQNCFICVFALHLCIVQKPIEDIYHYLFLSCQAHDFNSCSKYDFLYA